MSFLDTRFYNNSVQTWAIALGAAIAVYAALALVRHFVASRLRRSQSHQKLLWPGALLALVSSTRYTFLQVVSFYYATEVLVLGARTAQVISQITFLALLVQLALWGTAAIRFWVEHDFDLHGNTDGARAQSMRAIGFLASVVLYILIVLWGLDNFGVNITTLVAGLGVGGIAVALAVQNILGDLFASLTIVLDKPFVYGDYIVVGEFKGTIEHVGLKTTRVRSQSGEQLIFPNSDLLQSRIRNFKRMQERRVIFTLGVAYETPIEVLRTIPAAVKQIVEAQPKVRFERCHLNGLASSSLEFEVVYWVLDPEYTLHVDSLQNVNLGVLGYFQKNGISFASPTQSVIVKSMPKSDV